MSACRLINSRAQRPRGQRFRVETTRKCVLGPLCAVDPVNVEAGADQAAAIDGNVYSAPPAYPLYQPQQYQQLPPPPPPPPPPAAQGGGTPVWAWILLGAAISWVFGKVQEIRKNPAGAMLGMMSAMNKGKSSPSGTPDMAAMMKMMEQMQGSGAPGQPGFGAAPPFGGAAQGVGATIPTTAQDVTPSTRDGTKFEQNKQDSQTSEGTVTPPPPSQPSASASAGAGSAVPAFFTDSQTSSSSPAPQTGGASASVFSDSSSSGNAAASTPQDTASTDKLVENMLDMVAQNPELRKQMNEYLPESMRNEETWKWISSNPELRKQIAGSMSSNLGMNDFMNMSGTQFPPAAADAPANFQQAMDELKSKGIDPNNVMTELASDKEIMALFAKPHVTEAIMAIQKDPSCAVKYMHDPEVAKLMNKMVQLTAGGGMPPGGMPPGGMPSAAGGAAPPATPPADGRGGGSAR